jgi:sporulation protein YlmC with PRC-barrel domain
MKTMNRTMAPWMAAVLCVGVTSWARGMEEKDSPMTPANKETSTETHSCEKAPAKFNKASGILGMDVRNQSGEHLGKLKDVVFDLNTERVSYAVIDAGSRSLLSMNEKLLAVPVNALRCSEDGKHLILNAEKSKIETAQGFDPNDWPSVSNPSWGAEPFWQKQTESEMKPNPDPEDKPDQDPEYQPGQSDQPDTDPGN